MRKTLLTLILIIVALGFLHAETKLKMELWNRWTYQMIDGDVTKNEMALKRGYFRLEPKFSENIKGRFNVDFFSDDDDKVADGAGLKIKYAYLDFNNLIPINDSKLTIGLMKTYFGTIYEWNYTTIDGDPSDKYKFVSSTDFGFGVSGKIPNGFGSYALAVYNGEGYKKVGSNINKDLNYLANLRVTPIAGVTLGGSYMMKTKNDSEIADSLGTMIDNPDREEYSLIAGVGKFAFGPFSLLAQYLMKDKDKPNVDGYEKVNTTVVSLLPVFKVNNNFDILARYDIYDPDTDTDDDGYNTIVAGFNYHIMRDAKNKPKLFIQTNYQMKQYEADDSEDVSELLVQLRWIFSETINKGK